MVAGAGTQASPRWAKRFSIRAKCSQDSANSVKQIQLGAQGSRAESPKDNSPGQSESASDALGQPSTKFPSPERATQYLAGCRALTALKNIVESCMKQICLQSKPGEVFSHSNLAVWSDVRFIHTWRTLSDCRLDCKQICLQSNLQSDSVRHV